MSATVPAQSEGFAYLIVDGSAVIVDPRSHQLYWLNPVASRIWELADGAHTAEAIAGELCGEFEVDPGTARRDVVEMVRAFEAKGMFTPAAADADG